MKPKKQQSADRKQQQQSQSGAVSAPGTPAATTAAGDTGTTVTAPGSVVATATPTSAPVTAAPSTAKKPVKRLQSKAKEASTSSTEPTAGAAVPGAKSSEKLPTTQPVAGPVTGGSSTQSNKSKSSGGSVAIVAKTFHPPMGEPAQQPQVGDGPEVATPSKSASTTATGGGKTAKASKSAKTVDPSANSSTPGDPKKKTTPAKAAAKKGATPTDSGKQRKQSAAGQSAAATAVATSPAAKSAGPPELASPAADRLREKEKKIQKELKNLGVSDKTLHQIDAAYLLADESVNPSISEMVKTKSRTTVAHAKYGPDSHSSPGAMGASGRKPSLTTEDAPTVVGPPGDGDEKPHKEAASGGKAKKSVTIKLDEDKPPPAKGKAPKGGGRKAEEKPSPGPQPTAEGVGKGKAAATPRSSKSQKKTPETKQSQQQKKAAASEKGVTEQRKAASEDSGVTKQVSFEPGRGSSVEHEDHEEKNAAVQIQIDSIVKALEREDSDTGGTGGAKKDAAEQADKRNDSTSGAAQGKDAEVKVSTPAAGGAKKQAEPKPARKPALKKDTGSSKAAGEKKKGGGEKKEVTFKEQPPTSPAKRKYVKKPKPAGEKKPPAAKAAKPKPAATGGKSKASGGGGAGKAATAAAKAKTEPKGTAKPSTVAEPTVENETGPKPADGNDTIQVEEPARSEPSEVATTTPVKISTESQKSQEPPVVAGVGGTSLVPTTAQSVHRDRSSTENDDDVPLKQLQAKTQSIGSTKQPETHPATVEPEAVPSKPNGTPVATAAAAAAGPILAGLLKAGGSGAKTPKRPYVRKNPNPPGKGAKPMPGGCGPQGAKADQRKAPEKKDVYDFDDSESEIEAPVKAGKPSFKRKSSVDLCQSSREDISQPADDPAAKPKEPPKVQDAAGAKPQEEEASADERQIADEKASKQPATKKQKKRSETVPPSSVVPKPKKELRSGSSCSSSGSEAEDGRPLDNLVVPEAKVKKKAPPRRVKQESRESRSSDNEDEEGEPGDDGEDEDGEEQDDEEEDDEDEEDSDGCSSGDTVRTRIAKKRQSAKKRNLKLYGFWSGPKRHRVASLNAIAKVHCLYENERPAFDASLMVRQSSGSRVIRTITKDGERIKKERICDDESAEGGDGDGGRLSGGDGASEDQDVGKGGTAPSDRKGAGVKQERKPEPAATTERVAETKGAKVNVKVEPAKKEPVSDPESDSSEEEPVVTRTLRCVPGLRGAGKHWDPDASSMESDIEQLPDSDETYAQGKDTDPTRKRKLRKKAAARKSKAKQAALAKQEKDKDKAAGNEKPEKAPPKPPVKKIKKELKALLTDTERQDDGAASSESSTGSEKAAATTAAKSKDDGAKKRKREPKVERAANEGLTDYTEYIGKKRMASLNATAMLAATYEVQRTLYRNTDSSDSECSAAEKAPKSKKAKEQKDQKDAAKAAALATAAAAAAASAAAAADAREKKEAAAKEPPAPNVEEAKAVAAVPSVAPPPSPPDYKQVDLSLGGCCDPSALASSSMQPSTSSSAAAQHHQQQEVLAKKKKVVIKTEPMRDRKDDPMEVKREIEEPRPVSSNLVIAQDTEVTITGVYVNSTLGTNQEAYCKMQYRVQQSVTEERLVRPGDGAPPKSYTPLSALSSMRPPNDQSLSTPPLFVPPAQCDSPLLGPPRPSFYPPPTSSSGSSSAFCAPLPHDSPGYYQPAGPLISPHLLPQPPPLSQHGLGPLGGSKSSGQESESPLQGPQQPPASTTADSTDSDVLLTGGDLAPRGPGPYGGHHRYGPAAGPPPAANLYPRPLQMHCPPTYLPANYYASPYGQPPPPPPPPPHDMYYAHAYPPHYYPKFPPQYYPTRRQYYPGPPGPPGPEHLYEQPPPSSAPVAPPPPPPAGAQLVPAGPQGPQHLDHYPYAYPGYGSPGPGSGGQCYTRNLQHPPPYLDAHYTTNCPCPMQCPKNVNAGSLIGIKASKGPVATNNNNTNKNNHIVQSQTSTAEPLSSSSYTASSSSSASPASIDLHAPIMSPMAETVSKASATQAPPQHTYPHHHQPLQRPPLVEHHPPAPAHHPYHLHHPRHGGSLPPVVVVTTAPEVTPPPAHHPAKSVSSGSDTETSPQHPVVTTAPSNGGGGGGDHLHPAQMCYKAEQLIKPETSPPNLIPNPMHYGDPYLHHYHHPLGYYHHQKLADLKDDLHGPPAPPGSQYTMARLEPIDLHVSPPRGPAALGEKGMQPASLVELEAADGKGALHGSLLPPTTVVKREIEEFKLGGGVATLKGEAVCKKEDFEETGPAMTPELLPLLDDRVIVIKKDCENEKVDATVGVDGGVAATVAEGTFHQPAHRIHHMLHHLPHHHVHLASHHHHSASTNLLHHPRHHHLHPQHYGGSMQLVQQPPALDTIRPEQDTDMADTKLPIAPRDCKSDLAELVLTTESSMASGVPPSPSPATTTSSTSVICISSDQSGFAVGHHPRDISSDSSISFSDSVNPSTDGGDPASPGSGAFPASTVKRRALLVACKKSTTKQSPPNSYKNLIKRTNGDPDEGGELREQESLAPVELSDDEEEEEDDDDDEEEEDDGEEEEDAQDDEEEDVEKVETAEQARQADRMRAKRGRLASKIAICKKIAKMVVPGGRRKCPSSASLSSGSASNGSRKLLLLTQPHHSRWAFKNPSPPASRRLVKRVHRVFRTSIESLRKLPPRLGGGLVPTARRQRFVRKLRLSKSPARSVSDEASDTLTSSSMERATAVSVHPLDTSVTEVDQGQLPVTVNSPFDRTPEPTVDGAKDPPITSEPVKPPLSNVDRTIDLVARGYFSEPEILPTDLQKSAHSRAWLKKVKQQQQQEGRSHSEQSRGAKRDRDRSSDSGKPVCTKKTKKGAAAPTTPSSTESGTVGEKKSKSKTKSSKSAGDGLPNETDQVQPDASQRKTKNKSSRKESKKESKKAKKKRKLQDGSAEDCKKEQPIVGQPIPMEGELDSAYQRATSTPIRTHGVDGTEVDDHHGAGPCDESVAGCPLDQSSVVDDRETDFDDAATMLVEDDVASVDTSVLITRHNNNNNISTITDKNNPADEQLIVPAHPLQAIIADGKEGSELEPPEGMEPFLDDPMEDPEDVLQLQASVPHQQQQLSLPPPPPATAQSQVSPDGPIPMQTDYIDDYEYYDEEDELPPKRANSRTIKRKRTRPKPSKKFSTKKRHRRPSAHRYEVEEIIVPRRCSNIPRWSNGWTWEGQPFQGKVFLNSDDAPVLRTCYPAMRHSEGDIIRPRDCVLLRAGNKRSELPYVAKVAYLWENPEDGEMMMSLLWYYRPEHTEQGRQRADGPDEVFASRHKDHNSVACIEDKCYVLTFSEYCRFRRQMKGFEENVEEQPSIVPPPVQRRENPRLPPPVVSPELVMYCQRVYEFRLKRLLKTTS